MKRTVVDRTGVDRTRRGVALVALSALSLVLGVSGCSGPEADETLHATKGSIALCHHADGGRWVPLSVPEVAAETLVAHGDYLYDVSAGQCCTDAECPSGQPCNVVVGNDGNSIGVCGTPPTSITTDPIGLLLAVGIFGASSGAVFPFTGVLSRDTSDHYFFAFTVRGTNAQVQLTSFTFTGTAIPEGSSTPVNVTFPSRTDGLLTLPGPFKPYADYLNFSVATPTQSLTGSAQVNVDNGSAYYNSNTLEATFHLNGQTYDLKAYGTYTPPVTEGGGNFPAGLYFNLPNGSITVNIMVFRADAYAVNVL